LFALTSLPNHNTKCVVRHHHRAAGQGKWGEIVDLQEQILRKLERGKILFFGNNNVMGLLL